MEVGKNKLFSRQPFQLLLSKLSNSPNKHESAGSAAAGWPGPFVRDTAQPIPNPVSQPCRVIASPWMGKGLYSPAPHRGCATPSSATTDATRAASWDPIPVTTVPAEIDNPMAQKLPCALLGPAQPQQAARDCRGDAICWGREAGLTQRCHG